MQNRLAFKNTQLEKLKRYHSKYSLDLNLGKQILIIENYFLYKKLREISQNRFYTF